MILHLSNALCSTSHSIPLPTAQPAPNPVPDGPQPYRPEYQLERDPAHLPHSNTTWFRYQYIVRHALKLMQHPFVSLQIQHLKLCNTPQVELKIQLISPSNTPICLCYKCKTGRRKNPHEYPPFFPCCKAFFLATNTHLSLLQKQFLPLRRYHL